MHFPEGLENTPFKGYFYFCPIFKKTTKPLSINFLTKLKSKVDRKIQKEI